MKKSSTIFLSLVSTILIQCCEIPEETLTERKQSDSIYYYNHSLQLYTTPYYPYYPYYNYSYPYIHYEYYRGGFGYYGSYHSSVS